MPARSLHRRGGNTALVVLLGLGALVAAGAVVIDMGYTHVVGAQLQVGVDAAAMAAAAHLADGPAAARQAATTIAARNQAGGAPIELDPTDIEIGTWDADTSTFSALSDSDESAGDAVQISRTVGDVDTFLGRVLGFEALAVTRTSLAGTASDGGGVSCGVMADETATVTGSHVVDSYDSSVGLYDPADPGANAGVCSNGDVYAGGNGLIDGGLRCGPDDDDSVTVSGSADITGTIGALREEMELPSASSAAARTCTDNASVPRPAHGAPYLVGTDFSIGSGKSMVLPAGTYYFTSFSINGTARVTLGGPVTIYAAGNLQMNGRGIVNAAADPSDLTIYVDGSRTVRINGSSDYYGSVVAPESTVDVLGNADYYGILIAREARLSGNGDFHVDESMVESFLGEPEENRRMVHLR